MANPTTTVAKKLMTFLKMTPKADETAEQFAERLAVAAHRLDDASWSALGATKIGEKSQEWANKFLKAKDNGDIPLPLPPGLKMPENAPTKPVAKKAAAKSEGGRSKRAKLDDTITVLATENPYKPGVMHNYFASYKTGMTIDEAEKKLIELGCRDRKQARTYLNWDRRHKHITY